jgi:hypothetical protein
VSQDNLLKLSLKTHIMYMRYNNSVAQQWNIYDILKQKL